MEQTVPKISIIIPIYNCEDYIEECLLSALKQTISPKQIICVNDGSTDKSSIILKKIAANHPEIIIIEQENQGAGSARNNGMAIARGEYIAFLDGDDLLLDVDALETMYKICTENEVHVCRALKNNVDNSVDKREQYFVESLKAADDSVIMDYKTSQNDYDYMCYIYRRSLLMDNHISFPAYRRFQDPPFMVKALYYAGRFAVVNKWLYSYRPPEIISRFDSKKVVDMLDGIIDNLEFAAEHNLDILFDRSLDHVEYEYYDLINKFLPTEPDILRRLLVIDEIKRKREGENVLRFVTHIMNGLKKQDTSYSKDLLEKIKQYTQIYIYGAGHYGNIFFRFLKYSGLGDRVKGFIVSEIPALKKIDAIDIYSISEITEKEVPIFIATAGLDQKDIKKRLTNDGYQNVELLNTLFLDELERKCCAME